MDWRECRGKFSRIMSGDRFLAGGVTAGLWVFLGATYSFYLSPVVALPVLWAFGLVGICLSIAGGGAVLIQRLLPRLPVLTVSALLVAWFCLGRMDFPRIGWTMVGIGGAAGVITALAWMSRSLSVRLLALTADVLLFAAVTAYCVGSDADDSGADQPAVDHDITVFDYGSDGAVVDGSAYFHVASRIDNVARRLIWGFDRHKLPLAGKVFLPAAGEDCPLVVVLHGSHYMLDTSHVGYIWLARNLAARGYAVMLVDENFINKSFSGGYAPDDYIGRGWLLLKNLELLRDMANDPQSGLARKIDFDNVVLAGHSRGGDGIAAATWLNGLEKSPFDPSEIYCFDFGIKGVIEIAPTGMLTLAEGSPYKYTNVNYLLLHGDMDGDVSFMYGLLRYNVATFSDSSYHFKASVYIDGANHGQFNTVWGSEDRQPPASRLLAREGMIGGDAQRRLALGYIVPFLDVTLKGRGELPAEFSRQLQEGDIIQWSDTKCRYFADFEDDAGLGEVVELTLRDNRRMSQANHGVRITASSSHAVTVDSASIVGDGWLLIFSAYSDCDTRLAVVATGASGIVLSDTVRLVASPVKRLSRCRLIFPVQGDGVREQVLKSFTLPIKSEGDSCITGVTFSIPDSSGDCAVIVDNVGIRRHFEH